jgi:hypothetical protein
VQSSVPSVPSVSKKFNKPAAPEPPS